MTTSLREALRAVQDAEAAGQSTVTLTLAPWLARVMIDAAIPHFDPDVPAPPIARALGPLVGDVVMNGRLRRLDDAVRRVEQLSKALELTLIDATKGK